MITNRPEYLQSNRNIIVGPLPYMNVVLKGLSVRGFIVGRDFPQTKWAEAFTEMGQWIKEVFIYTVLYNSDLIYIFFNLASYFRSIVVLIA